MPLNRRQFLTVSAAAAAATVVRPRLSYASADDMLIVRGSTDIQILDPAFQNGSLEEEVGRCLFPSLNRLTDVRATAGWETYAAKRLVQKSPTEIEFELHDWLEWTDGFGPVTAEDVKFSFERVAKPANNSPWAYAFDTMSEVEVLGPRTGIIRLKMPSVPFWVTTLPYYMGHIVSRNAVEKVGGKFTTEPPATAGPYLIDAWTPKQSLLLKSNPAWKGPKPAFSTVKFEIVLDDEAAALAYEAKAFSYTKVSLNTLSTYRETLPEASELIEMDGRRLIWLSLNLANPKFADERVRRAIQYAVDVGQIMAGSYSSLAQPATGVVPSGMIGHREAILYTPDLEKAQALLEEAGVSDLAITLSALNDKTSLLTCQIVQALLGAIGVTVEINALDDAVFWTLGDAAPDGSNALELVLMNFAGGVDPAENLAWFRPSQIGQLNWSRFNSPDFENLYLQAMAEADQAKRDTMYQKMQDLMEKSGGFVFITHETFAAVARQGVKPFLLADGYMDIARFEKA